MIQKTPTIRNRKPRMSASAANVFSGLMKQPRRYRSYASWE